MARLLAALLALWASPAMARVQCSFDAVEDIRRELAEATAVFEGELLAAGRPLEDVAQGQQGVASRALRFRVTRVLRGPLEVGQELSVVWEGWSEPEGRRVGGCAIPAPREGATAPQPMIVLAAGAPDALRVPNRTASTQLHPLRQDAVDRIRRLTAGG